MTGRRKLASAALWRFSEVGLSEATSFAVFLALARLVAPDAFGVVALAAVCIALGQPILTQGIGEALIQRPRVSSALLDTAFWANMALGIALAVCALIFGPLLAAITGEARLGGALAAMSPIYILMAAGAIFQAKLRRELNFKAIALRSIIAIVVGGATGLVLAAHGYGYYALIGQQIAHNATSLVVLMLASSWKPKLRMRRTHLKQLIAFARHTGVSSFTDFLVNRADILIAGLFLSTHAVALYFFAKRIVFAAGLFTYYSIQQIGLPLLARRLQQQDTRAARGETALMALTLSTLICAPALVALALLADPLIAVSAGEEWRAAAGALSILALGAAAMGLRITSGQALIADGRPDVYARLTLMSAMLALGLVAIGATQGLLGAALGATLAHLLTLPFVLRALGARFHLTARALARPLVRGLLPCSAMAGAMWVSMPDAAHHTLLIQLAQPACAGLLAWLCTVLAVFAPELSHLMNRNPAPATLRTHPAADR